MSSPGMKKDTDEPIIVLKCGKSFLDDPHELHSKLQMTQTEIEQYILTGVHIFTPKVKNTIGDIELTKKDSNFQ